MLKSKSIVIKIKVGLVLIALYHQSCLSKADICAYVAIQSILKQTIKKNRLCLLVACYYILSPSRARKYLLKYTIDFLIALAA